MTDINQKTDFTTLRWIHDGLDETLLVVRHSLESYMENVESNEDIKLCITQLHQVLGTLRMVQVFGAAMLVDEMEKTAVALAEKNTASVADAASAIMMGVVQLPLYLERVSKGEPDIPLVLLPILNELRAARREPLVSEISLFAPQLDKVIESERVAIGGGNKKIPRLVINARMNYHRALLKWFTGTDKEAGLERLRKIFEVLNARAATARFRRLLEAAEALTISLQDNGIDESQAIKQIFGAIDRVFKKIVEQGEDAGLEDFPIELLKNVLYYVSTSTSKNPVVKGVQQASDSVNSFPVQKNHGDGPSTVTPALGKDLFSAVSSEISRDLEWVKDKFELYSSARDKDVNQIVDIKPVLQRIGDTLGMIGQGELHTLIRENLEKIPDQKAIIALSDKDLMAMASDILRVESALTNLENVDDGSSRSESSEDELNIHVEAVLQEILIEFSAIKAIVDQYLLAPKEQERLADTPGLIKKVSGALRVADLNSVAELLDVLQAYFEGLLDKTIVIPDQDLVNAVADVITSAEFYLETVLEGGSALDNIILYAKTAIEKLNDEIYAEADLSILDIDDGLPSSIVHMDEDTELGESDFVDESSLVDTEIIDIFAEEAEETIAIIYKEYPLWREDERNQESLFIVRRAFHTLKGSGRMVNANEIGEFSWQIENLLNRIIDSQVKLTIGILSLLDEAVVMLPILLKAQKRGSIASIDAIQEIEKQAADFASGVIKPSIPSGRSEKKTSEVEAILPLDEKRRCALRMEGELYVIFRAEAETHLKTVNEFIAFSRNKSMSSEYSFDLTRALHTLKGSSRTSEVLPMAELSGAMESYINLLIEKEQRSDKTTINLLEQLTKKLQSLLLIINVPDVAIPEWKLLFDEINHRMAGYESINIDDVSNNTDLLNVVVESKASEIYDEDVLKLFLEEATELIIHLEQVQSHWEKEPQNLTKISEIQRDLHTLKGGAHLARVVIVGDFIHAMESLFESLVEKRIETNEQIQRLARYGFDHLFDAVELLNLDRIPDEKMKDLITTFTAAASGKPWALPLFTDAQANNDPIESTNIIGFPKKDNVKAGRRTRPEPLTKENADAKGKQESINVDSSSLDDMVNYAGEVGIYHARLEQQNANLGGNLEELGNTVNRLQDQLRSLELETETQILSRHKSDDNADFDPLEMDQYSAIQQFSRGLSETVNDLTNIEDTLVELSRENDTLLGQQARINTDLQDGLLRTRMVPLDSQIPKLQRLVRQISHNLGKEAELIVNGAEGEMDRSVLNRIMPAFDHILRNAIAHGIEDNDIREALGKSKVAAISLSLVRDAGDVVISIADDGAGLDLDAIKKRAIERGLIESDAEIKDEDLYPLILEPGFTTSADVTQVSGRGVGMDAVISLVKQLGGSLDISSVSGEGAQFDIRLPFTLAITDALLARIGSEVYAISHGSIQGVIRGSKKELESAYSNEKVAITYDAQDYEVRYLGEMLGMSHVDLSDKRKHSPLLLVHSGEHFVALHVDDILGNYQIVVKSIGRQLSSIRWFTGGTILADGTVALILDTAALVRFDTNKHIQEIVNPNKVLTDETRVLVVDDSVTVRKVTQRLLERHDMLVTTAKDGVDALDKLHNNKPDIVLLDIEMPRMDGFELARHMRSTPELEGVPIIMITSRTGDRHRLMAEELGVKRYLGKPYQETILLENIYQVLDEGEL